jgi:2-methylisocitrate lyase-like PEP mutase family enzyme
MLCYSKRIHVGWRGSAIAEQAGFSAAYVSGASTANTRFGRPDIGLVGMSEAAETL